MGVRQTKEKLKNTIRYFGGEPFYYVSTWNNKKYTQMQGQKFHKYAGQNYRVIKVKNGMYRLYAESL